ncbi:MAG: membrane protein insertion efficiency factor YidD [Spartobacteria bacterium]|nr:membrane protein insertion efficiency factor YidD [Spartobacteria bacterium]
MLVFLVAVPRTLSGLANTRNIENVGPVPHGILWRAYQSSIGKADGDRCPMEPSCSAYAEQAIRKHGWLTGWIMAFDRFGHEGTEAQRTAHGVTYRNGKLKAVDRVEDNDFWWAHQADERSQEIVQAGRENLLNVAESAPRQIDAFVQEDLRAAGQSLLRAGASDQATTLLVSLWQRDQSPNDALLAALSLLEAGEPEACAAFLDSFLKDASMSPQHKAIAYFAQGLAFRERQLFDAATDAFDKAIAVVQDKDASEILSAYSFESKLEADKWPSAATTLERIDTSQAKAIRCEMTEDFPFRSPALAGTLSAIVPGSGQVYCGRYQEGFWAFVVCGAFAFASYEAFDHDLDWVGAVTTLTGLSWYSGNIYGATSAAHKYNRRARDERISNWIERLGVTQGNGQLKVMLKFQF